MLSTLPNLTKITKHLKFYRGSFNYHGRVHAVCRYAFSKPQAKREMLEILSKNLRQSLNAITFYFSSKKPNYEIAEVKVEMKPKEKSA